MGIKLRDIDLREIQKSDTRLRAVKERIWDEDDGHVPGRFFIKIILVSMIIALAILFIAGLFFTQ